MWRSAAPWSLGRRSAAHKVRLRSRLRRASRSSPNRRLLRLMGSPAASIPPSLSLIDADDVQATRVVDFCAGLAFCARGSIDKVTSRVYLFSPPTTEPSPEPPGAVVNVSRGSSSRLKLKEADGGWIVSKHSPTAGLSPSSKVNSRH
ncbi:DUF552 domain-containing protein [Pseudonocardiaceae bacterium YIM PH 21723]|nr:DUF552 domain-containing protein [Pseudonocardiaceae bacterium YIM PH 21723]